MPTSAPGTTPLSPTRQPRDHPARVEARSAANLAAFPPSAVISEANAKPPCKKTAEDMHAEMNEWAEIPAVPVATSPAFINPGKAQHDAKKAALVASLEVAPAPVADGTPVVLDIHGNHYNLMAQDIVHDENGLCGSYLGYPMYFRLDTYGKYRFRLMDGEKVVVRGWYSDFARFAIENVKKEADKLVAAAALTAKQVAAPETELQVALREFHSSWGNLDGLRRTEIANVVFAGIQSKDAAALTAWKNLSTTDKARLSEPVMAWFAPECDRDGRRLSSREQAESLVQRCQSPVSGNIYDTVYLPGLNLMRCNCQAGMRREDCYHIEGRIERDGDLIQSVYGSAPRRPSEATAMEHGLALKSAGVCSSEDFD